MLFQPQRPSCDGWIDPRGIPPFCFVATAVNLAVMSPAQRHREFIADLAAERGVLRATFS
jgi:hypothetical protein